MMDSHALVATEQAFISSILEKEMLELEATKATSSLLAQDTLLVCAIDKYPNLLRSGCDVVLVCSVVRHDTPTCVSFIAPPQSVRAM